MAKIRDEIKDKFERNYNMVAENDMEIAYQSTVRGVSRRKVEELGKEIGFVYYGVVFSIPKEDFPEKLDELEPSFESFMSEFDDCTPMPGGMIERHEVVDVNTGDVHVMYRVPYIEKPTPTPDLPE